MLSYVDVIKHAQHKDKEWTLQFNNSDNYSVKHLDFFI